MIDPCPAFLSKFAVRLNKTRNSLGGAHRGIVLVNVLARASLSEFRWDGTVRAHEGQEIAERIMGTALKLYQGRRKGSYEIAASDF
jgi:hypothetical protein